MLTLYFYSIFPMGGKLRKSAIRFQKVNNENSYLRKINKKISCFPTTISKGYQAKWAVLIESFW